MWGECEAVWHPTFRPDLCNEAFPYAYFSFPVPGTLMFEGTTSKNLTLENIRDLVYTADVR